VTASAAWEALGTTVAVAVTDHAAVSAARSAVERELAAIDAACSRFRPDAELVWLNARNGRPTRVSPLLLEAIEVALRAARVTGGAVDPTLCSSLEAAGYDRDLAALPPDGPRLAPVPGPGAAAVRLDRARREVELRGGARLDLGATAKALAADRAAAAAEQAAPGAGVLVSLGGDVAVAGMAPSGGWAIAIAEDHGDAAPSGPVVAVRSGGLATSTTTLRRWRRGGRFVHHILDPATGEPAAVYWRTASVAAATCVDANIGSTAAIVLGPGAVAWLERNVLPARLVAADGRVATICGWAPEAEAA
jgi:thiamine biosynthesis lipoprotein